ncbi:ISAs1 family transposase [Streptomyces sp. NPDC002619]|uniref:ISAs1 family transposase n=1 Tax=Streptomyces sp. NPDC002619 TaxID=3364655 RepID=UPI0036BF760F
MGRLLARLDGDTVDDAVGAWLARRATDPVDEPDRLTGLAVDGKTVRGSRTDGHAVHLLAATLHGSQTVIAQRQVAAKSNEIPAFAPLLEHLDLRGVVVTADAMHTQREHAHHIIAAGGRYLLVVKGNQKKLRKQIKRLPWSEIQCLAAPPQPATADARSAGSRCAPSRPACVSRPARPRRRPSTPSPASALSKQAPPVWANSSRTTGRWKPCTTCAT